MLFENPLQLIYLYMARDPLNGTDGLLVTKLNRTERNVPHYRSMIQLWVGVKNCL